MPLQPGARIGPYEITGTLGVGGMGEVYRARDHKLDREVAIKVLPDSVATDPERLSRFEREAKTLAALNHQNIAHVYDADRLRVTDATGQGPEVAYLAMELVEGEDLSAAIARGPIPADASLPIVKQIAEALEVAHEAGVIHRDLKPANIKVRNDGAAKVLDFGLAKALGPEGVSSGPGGAAASGSTMTSPAITGLGVILGTASYMAPEQARGRPVDKRADIWAFGAVWFEMLTGRTPFPGETMTDVIAAVVTREPDWSLLPATTPPLVRRLLARCLEKDPRQRLRDIGEVRLALGGGSLEPGALPSQSSGPSRVSRLGWIAAGVLLALLGAAVFWPRAQTTVEPRPLITYDVVPPGKTVLRLDSRPAVAIAPDGGAIVFVATDAGVTKLYLRRRNDPEARPLAGTDGGSDPVFSPDGKSLAFAAPGALMKMALDGAPVQLAKLGDARGIAWLDDAHIVFSPEAVGGLFLVPAAGGEAKPLTTLDVTKDDRTHRWPAAVPGGKAVLFTVGTLSSPDNYDDSRIDAVIVATGERRKVMDGASFVRVGPDGLLLYAKAGNVYAVAFDSRQLTTNGKGTSVLQGVSTDTTTGAAHAAVGPDGTLTYVPGGASTVDREIFWVDRKGATTRIPLTAGLYNDIKVSPDGRRIAVLMGSSGSGDIGIYDIQSTVLRKLTLDRTNATPVWSPDGKSLYYASVKPDGKETTIFKRPVDGARDAVAIGTVKMRAYMEAVDSAETTAYIFRYGTAAGQDVDIESVPIGKGAPSSVAGGRGDQLGSAISPDGRWLAYQSSQDNRPEVYVLDLKGGARFQVSTTGGEEPHWSTDSTEIFYRNDTQFMAAAVTTKPEFRSNPPIMLFDGAYNLRSDTGITYDIDRTTGRFVMLRPAGQAPGAPAARVRLIVNWLDEFRRKQQK